MPKPYIKLDYDWREDPKVMVYEQRHKKAALVDLIEVFILMADCGGYLDTNNEGHMLKACKTLGKTPAGVRKILSQMAECDLIRKDGWEKRGIATSDRANRDAVAKDKRRENALAASNAAAEKRRAERGGGNP